VFPLFWPYGETARGYREDGYYPEAFINMIALLGWNPGTEQEIFSMAELIDAFSIERVHKAGSRFDPEKARWFNHTYLQKRTDATLAIEFREELRTHGFHLDLTELEKLVSLVKERVSFIKEMWEQTDFFFRPPESYDKDVIKKRWNENSAPILSELKGILVNSDNFTSISTEEIVKKWIEEKGYNTGSVMSALRLVIVGASRGPHIFDIIEWIGKEETLKRIDKGIEVLGK
jgi:glutamyl-tRNA synthetase